MSLHIRGPEPRSRTEHRLQKMSLSECEKVLLGSRKRKIYRLACLSNSLIFSRIPTADFRYFQYLRADHVLLAVSQACAAHPPLSPFAALNEISH